jgi:hypothetical protein
MNDWFDEMPPDDKLSSEEFYGLVKPLDRQRV